MRQKQLQALVLDVQKWIVNILAEHETQMEPIASVPFDRLGEYYPSSLLQRIRRVLVDQCPVPPLAYTGIAELKQIENWDIKGIPWKDTIFIRRDLANWEAIHFHELLHIIQWEYLGTERYLTAWAIGTTKLGYRANPLEKMAFRHQSRFETEKKPYNVVREVTAEISILPNSIFDIRKLS